MKAIWTKFFPATNHKGSRVKASAEGVPSVYVPGDGGRDEDVHASAALALCAKMGWPGNLYRGARPDGVGYVFVFDAPSEWIPNPVPSYAEQDKARKTLVGGAR